MTVVASLPTTMRLARPRCRGSTLSGLMPSSSLITCPPVRTAQNGLHVSYALEISLVVGSNALAFHNIVTDRSMLYPTSRAMVTFPEGRKGRSG